MDAQPHIVGDQVPRGDVGEPEADAATQACRVAVAEIARVTIARGVVDAGRCKGAGKTTHAQVVGDAEARAIAVGKRAVTGAFIVAVGKLQGERRVDPEGGEVIGTIGTLGLHYVVVIGQAEVRRRHAPRPVVASAVVIVVTRIGTDPKLQLVALRPGKASFRKVRQDGVAARTHAAFCRAAEHGKRFQGPLSGYARLGEANELFAVCRGRDPQNQGKCGPYP